MCVALNEWAFFFNGKVFFFLDESHLLKLVYTHHQLGNIKNINGSRNFHGWRIYIKCKNLSVRKGVGQRPAFTLPWLNANSRSIIIIRPKKHISFLYYYYILLSTCICVSVWNSFRVNFPDQIATCIRKSFFPRRSLFWWEGPKWTDHGN